MIQYLQQGHLVRMMREVSEGEYKKSIQNTSVDLVWFAKCNAPTPEIKSKFDSWFNEPQISNMMKIWHGPDVTKKHSTLKLDKKFIPIARRLGWGGTPYHTISFSPDDKHILKLYPVMSAVGRVYNRNNIERISREQNLAVKVPKKYLYIEPNAAQADRDHDQEPRIFVIADKVDLSVAKPWDVASTDLQKHLEIVKKKGCPLDFGSDNITYHEDAYGRRFVIIDTEEPLAVYDKDFPRAPEQVVQDYLRWEKRQKNAKQCKTTVHH